MKVLIASPYLAVMRGNSLTALRIQRSIQALQTSTDMNIDVIDYHTTESINEAYDFLHILNPVRFIQSPLLKQIQQLAIHYGVTFTGTDVNEHLDHHDSRVVDLLNKASFITVFHNQARDKVVNFSPEVANNVHVVPQGFYRLEEPYSVHGTIDTAKLLEQLQRDRQEGFRVAVLPAGIRKVKRVPWAIELVTRFNQRNQQKLKLYIVGPTIEQEEQAKIELQIHKSQDVTYLGELPQGIVLKIVEHADVLLNSSSSEGQSIAIIEAFHMRTPVVASKCPGNEQMIIHGKNGYLFLNESEFVESLQRIICDQSKTEELVDEAYRIAQMNYSAMHEAKQYLALYKADLCSSGALTQVNLSRTCSVEI
ncbi:hypothetical protein BHU72_10305 [Desulfuribacillus stibiiarsenatis]|uniref:Glycosyl transferase family 1 domain-containing protein n=1 Tax=Desulfuribacillus stibiiarsenatis TaxID=1390249 RepID=A0A1E5L937_9FIRM|nr:glycosyltransferase family 4 protein [Desulfuribacillus stibiiarsenatis]OEH86636.1 hypothetical protein BHU72_10305 [Desulfuribacillus stibiiarsenatis]